MMPTTYMEAAKAGIAKELAHLPYKSFLREITLLRTKDLMELQVHSPRLAQLLVSIQVMGPIALPLLFCFNNRVPEKYTYLKYGMISKRVEMLFADAFKKREQQQFQSCRKFVFKLLEFDVSLPDSDFPEFSTRNTITNIFYTLAYLRTCDSKDEFIVAILCMKILKRISSVKKYRMEFKAKAHLVRDIKTRSSRDSFLGQSVRDQATIVLILIELK